MKARARPCWERRHLNTPREVTVAIIPAPAGNLTTFTHAPDTIGSAFGMHVRSEWRVCRPPRKSRCLARLPNPDRLVRSALAAAQGCYVHPSSPSKMRTRCAAMVESRRTFVALQLHAAAGIQCPSKSFR
jgi:hypothetical protein